MTAPFLKIKMALIFFGKHMNQFFVNNMVSYENIKRALWYTSSLIVNWALWVYRFLPVYAFHSPVMSYRTSVIRHFSRPYDSMFFVRKQGPINFENNESSSFFKKNGGI